jgi:formylglycine-generating enzyme required for sulfatase activity
VALPIIELIDDEAPEAVVQLLPGMAPEGRPGLRNWADVWARRLGIGASRQWWRKHRVSFAAGCVGLALLAVVIWFLVRPQKDRQIAAEGSSVAAGPSGGPDSSSASEIPSGSARAAAAGPAPPLAIAPFDAAKAKEHQQAWADYLGVPVETTNSIGMKFVLIPPGEFEMGSSLEDVDRLVSRARQQNLPQWYADCISSEAPRHRVRLTRAFYLGLCEVTQAQYQRVAGSNPSGFQESGPDAPVESVSWEEAAGFCRLLSDMPGEKGSAGRYGLPTEAQWEYAARAGTTTAWSFGDDVAALSDHAWWSLNSERKTHSVGLKKPNAFGLLDVHGNVFEWCADWHSEEYYENSALADPTGPASGESRVLRGGSWSGDDPNLFRCAYRLNYPADYRSPGYGFRVARALTP